MQIVATILVFVPCNYNSYAPTELQLYIRVALIYLPKKLQNKENMLKCYNYDNFETYTTDNSFVWNVFSKKLSKPNLSSN